MASSISRPSLSIRSCGPQSATRRTSIMGKLCPLTRKLCARLDCDPPSDCVVADSQFTTRGHQVGPWKPHYLWYPRYFPLVDDFAPYRRGNWVWRRWIFRRRAWNQAGKWWEYSLFPLPGTPIYSKYSGISNGPQWDLCDVPTRDFVT